MRQIVLLTLAIAAIAHAGPRSAAARLEFRRGHPCPSTGQTSGACPGYVIDHRYPLCAGGEDAPRNMQWQTIEDSRRKDAEERRLCRAFAASGIDAVRIKC
jgi:hypothetical protein